MKDISSQAVARDRVFFSSRSRHTRCGRDWSSDVCSSDLELFRYRLRKGGGQPEGDSGRAPPPPRAARARVGPARGRGARSEERRVGKECRGGWSAYRRQERDRRTLRESTHTTEGEAHAPT